MCDEVLTVVTYDARTKLILVGENSRHFERYHWFPREMKYKELAKKFHSDDVSLPKSWPCF